MKKTNRSPWIKFYTLLWCDGYWRVYEGVTIVRCFLVSSSPCAQDLLEVLTEVQFGWPQVWSAPLNCFCSFSFLFFSVGTVSARWFGVLMTPSLCSGGRWQSNSKYWPVCVRFSVHLTVEAAVFFSVYCTVHVKLVLLSTAHILWRFSLPLLWFWPRCHPPTWTSGLEQILWKLSRLCSQPLPRRGWPPLKIPLKRHWLMLRWPKNGKFSSNHYYLSEQENKITDLPITRPWLYPWATATPVTSLIQLIWCNIQKRDVIYTLESQSTSCTRFRWGANALGSAAAVKISALKMGLNNVLTKHFRISQLLETWIAAGDLCGAIFCFFYFFIFVFTPLNKSPSASVV